MKVDVEKFEEAQEEAQGTSELQLIRRNAGGQLVVLSIIFVRPATPPGEKQI
tara:strand:- start:6461 stop:6616 length:156 start_codon:yes stop_codon:yes gene_type:complete